MAKTTWEIAAENCQKITRNSLNQDWLLPEDQLPPAEQLNVADFVETCGFLTTRERDITNTSAVDLVQQMAAGSLTAVDTVTAFLKRAHVVHQLTNFATEFLVDAALETAAELDAHFKATRKIKGPLHGIPISVKEHISIKGLICHSSYVVWADNIAEDDALIVKCAKAAGGVIHVRTNIPQTLLNFDCVNLLNGRTHNPHNRSLSPGGSSGGEGVSTAMRCAPIGIGTDVGGSVRIPAGFCGSYGLRTTALRNPFGGIVLAGAGHEGIRCIAGPLGNNTEDLALFQKAILDQEPWEEETSLVPIPWRNVKPCQPGDITVGVIWEDGLVRPHPPITRALRYAVDKLKAAGVKVVDFEPHRHAETFELAGKLLAPDGFVTQRKLLAEGNEIMTPAVEWSMNVVKPESITLEENWKLNLKRDTFRNEYYSLKKKRGVDFLLCPVFPGVAPERGQGRYFHYTAVWNLLDWPCAAFPTGLKVDQTLDPIDTTYEPTNPNDEMEYQLYSPEKYSGAPIALQVVGKHMRDEETLAATTLISGIVRK